MKIYLDTNIIRDYMQNRKQVSVQIVERARENKWDCVTSVLGMMEISDLEKDTIFFKNTVVNESWEVDKFLAQRRNKSLSDSDFETVHKYLTQLTIKVPFLDFLSLSEDGWRYAIFLVSKSNLTSPDAIHLATAITSKSNIIITNDSGFIKSGNGIIKKINRNDEFRLCLPEKFEQTAKDLKIRT